MGPQMTMETKSQSRPISQAELRELLLSFRAENWRGIQAPEMQVQIAEAMLQPEAGTVLSLVAQFWPIPPGARTLAQAWEDLWLAAASWAIGRSEWNRTGSEQVLA
jgi:hypothetical protein